MSRLTAHTDMQPASLMEDEGAANSGSGPRRLDFCRPDVQSLSAQNGKLIRIRGSQPLFWFPNPPTTRDLPGGAACQKDSAGWLCAFPNVIEVSLYGAS